MYMDWDAPYTAAAPATKTFRPKPNPGGPPFPNFPAKSLNLLWAIATKLII